MCTINDVLNKAQQIIDKFSEEVNFKWTIELSEEEFNVLKLHFNTHPFDPYYENTEFNKNPKIYGMKILVKGEDFLRAYPTPVGFEVVELWYNDIYTSYTLIPESENSVKNYAIKIGDHFFLLGDTNCATHVCDYEATSENQ